MDDQYAVFLIGGDDDERAVFTLIEQGDAFILRCDYRGNSIERRATDYFQALADIRLCLVEDGLIPSCYGASLNVYPSGMAREMGQGLKAYKLEVSRQAKSADLVDVSL